MTTRHDPYAAFRQSDYRRYLLGWLAALLGTRIQSVAIGWEIYQRTGEALALGMVGLVQALPTILLALPAGYLADRWPRRRLIMLSLAGMTLTSLGLALVSWFQGPILLMYGLLLLDAACVAVGRPARLALLPRLVPRVAFSNAVTWNTSMFQISSVVGPAIGGFVIAAHVPSAYLLAACGSVVFVLLLARMNLASAAEAPGEAGETDRLANLLAGMRFVRRKRVILAAVSLDMFAVLFGGAVYLLPIFAEDILGVGARGFGWLNAAPAAGAFCMAMLLAHRPPMRQAGRNLLVAVAGFGAATVVFGLSKSFWLSLAMLFLTGALDNISVVVRHTLVQMLTPDRMRGRVSAVNGVFIGISNELGGLESGLVAHWFGPVVSVVSGGLGTIAVVIATAWASPKLRRIGALDEIGSQEDALPVPPAPIGSGPSRPSVPEGRPR